MKKTRNLPRFLLFLLFILSIANLSSSQPNPDSPRNIETFYPFPIPPPSPTPSDNGINGQTSPSASPKKNSKTAIMTAVGATAASTFVLASIFFLVFTWFSRSRRRKQTENPPLAAVVAAGSRSEYKRLEGNVRGYIIDEDGLDVLYWKKLSNSGGFKKEPYNSAENANGKRPVVPRGRSSSSNAQVQRPPPPPPPPPTPVKKNPPPPPPMAVKRPPAPPKSKTLASGEEGSGSGNDEQVKMKALHWEKVNVNPDQTMVWNNIEKGSFQYNGDMMEALFGVVATNRRSPKPQSGESSNPNPQIFILEPRKSQNISIIIKSLTIPHNELIESLLQSKGLTAETLEKLTRLAPTTEEASKIMAFDGDPSNLADAESFLYYLLKAIPTAFARVDEMMFRLIYDSEISTVKDSLQTVESACNELRSRGIFLKLLEAILKAGNRLNAGTARGDAKAFNLTTLKRLSDYKSSDGKTTLLHFVVHEVVRNEGRRCVLARSNSIGRSNVSLDDSSSKEEKEKEFLKLGLPVVGGLSSEFLNVKKAAGLDYDTLKGTISSLSTNVRDKEGEFFESAEVEIKAVEEDHIRVMDLVKRTTQYYQAGASNDKQPLQLFVIVKDFLSTVDQTCVEIARSLQQKKQVTGGGESSSGSPQSDVLRSRVTFPRLPEHFLSDKSSSGSDDDS